MKNPICARDLRVTHLINNLAPSSSPRDSLSHLCFCWFSKSLRCVRLRTASGWNQSVLLPVSLSMQIHSYLRIRPWCLALPWIKPDQVFLTAPEKNLLCLGSKLELTAVLPASLIWMRIAGQSGRPLTEHAAGRAFAFSHILADISSNPLPVLLASPKWSNWNETVIQFRVVLEGEGMLSICLSEVSE